MTSPNSTRNVFSECDHVEAEVLRRYAQGAEHVEASLCCPTDRYASQHLTLLPKEIVEKDYGCGDPSRYVSPGESAVDLGCGVGKICYILAQKVGERGVSRAWISTTPC